jgi:hypothetical protein
VAPTVPTTLIAAEVAPEASETEAVATIPSAIGVVFRPTATQVYAALLPEHETVLPAAVRAGPAVTEKAPTDAGG